jgi:hypothetical protein
MRGLGKCPLNPKRAEGQHAPSVGWMEGRTAKANLVRFVEIIFEKLEKRW